MGTLRYGQPLNLFPFLLSHYRIIAYFTLFSIFVSSSLFAYPEQAEGNGPMKP
jgi:hypothetical protein